MLTKEKAVASLGQSNLLLPAWVKAALAANDRLKLYLSVLQGAQQHARKPDQAPFDWSQELAGQTMTDATWLRDLVRMAYLDGQILVFPQQDQLLEALSADLDLMARPLCDSSFTPPSELSARKNHWLEYLKSLRGTDGLPPEATNQLTHGNPKAGDSLHLLVMALHKQLNALASEIATENLDGAHVWQITPEDTPLVQAFMRGLNRTAPLKFLHPGLDTAATRDGDKLLIQNDIGTNDAHVLVLEVRDQTLSLTYSDLHAARFDFFCRALARFGFTWKVQPPVATEGLNKDKPYHLGRAVRVASSPDDLRLGLEQLASRIVFLIDWNKARKSLRQFVGKASAIRILEQAAEGEYGHRGWLQAGGTQLIFGAMQTVESEVFRVGDRLDQVLGEDAAADYLREVLRMASQALLAQQPPGVVADEARLALMQFLKRRTFEFDFLAEHAAYCHALAQGLTDAIDTAQAPDAQRSAILASRGKAWERQADHVLMDARQRAIRQPRWKTLVALLEQADDVADAVEEAWFLHRLTHSAPLPGLPTPVQAALLPLAATTQEAIQDWVRAIEIARHLRQLADAADNEAFLQCLWRILRAERQCDELLRAARTAIVEHLHQKPAEFQLATDLASTLEAASDSLLRSGYALRELIFEGH